MKVNIVTGWSKEGGSTHSLMELCDLFNERGLECTMYGPHNWFLDKCSNAKLIINFGPDRAKGAINIIHFTPTNMVIEGSKKTILSSHETRVFPLKGRDMTGVDAVRFVSERQKAWQGVEGTVIPNLVRGICNTGKSPEGVAGVVGTIHPIKGVHESIKRALDDGYEKVLIYGNCTDQNYYNNKIEPLLSDKVEHMGMELDRQKIYDSVSCVYQSNIDEYPETFGRVRAECMRAGIPYYGNDSATTDFELWEEDKVFEEWMRLMTS
jgi:glycosyltransferase involved in cell wall biosynthesis